MLEKHYFTQIFYRVRPPFFEILSELKLIIYFVLKADAVLKDYVPVP